MAIARKCDRCNTYHDGHIYKATIYSRLGLDIIESEYDLCEDCIDEFAKFINGAKPKNLLDRIMEMTKRKD